MSKRFGHVVCFALGLAIGSLVLARPEAAHLQTGPRVQAETADIVVLRYFRIKKGSFPEIYRVSAEDISPYYERAGARIMGMWQVAYPALPGQTQRENPDYDEAYLLTRYASIEHWQAT